MVKSGMQGTHADAHRLRRVPEHEANGWHHHGIGDRYVELLLPEPSFAALKALFAEFEKPWTPFSLSP